MVAKVVQWVVYWPMRFYLKLFRGLTISGAENLNNLPKPLLIIANHKSILDPFIIGASLPFRWSYFPVRYVAGSKFSSSMLTKLYSAGFIAKFYALFGAIHLPIGGTREEKLQPIIDCLGKKEFVVIFPEGRLNTEKTVKEFRTGAAEIALRMGVPILPVAHTASEKKIFLKFGEVENKIKTQETLEIYTTHLKKRLENLFFDLVNNSGI